MDPVSCARAVLAASPTHLLLQAGPRASALEPLARLLGDALGEPDELDGLFYWRVRGAHAVVYDAALCDPGTLRAAVAAAGPGARLGIAGIDLAVRGDGAAWRCVLEGAQRRGARVVASTRRAHAIDPPLRSRFACVRLPESRAETLVEAPAPAVDGPPVPGLDPLLSRAWAEGKNNDVRPPHGTVSFPPVVRRSIMPAAAPKKTAAAKKAAPAPKKAAAPPKEAPAPAPAATEDAPAVEVALANYAALDTAMTAAQKSLSRDVRTLRTALTKVARLAGMKNLSAEKIKEAADAAVETLKGMETVSTEVGELVKTVRTQKRAQRALFTRAKKTRRTNTVSVFSIPVAVEKPLADFLGLKAGEKIARKDVTRRIGEYLRDKGLKEGSKILVAKDAALKALLKPETHGIPDAELTFPAKLQRCLAPYYKKQA